MGFWLEEHTPTIITSYFSSSHFSPGENGEVNRGSGGAKDGSTRKSREEDAYSLKTGILSVTGTRGEVKALV